MEPCHLGTPIRIGDKGVHMGCDPSTRIDAGQHCDHGGGHRYLAAFPAHLPPFKHLPIKHLPSGHSPLQQWWPFIAGPSTCLLCPSQDSSHTATLLPSGLRDVLWSQGLGKDILTPGGSSSPVPSQVTFSGRPTCLPCFIFFWVMAPSLLPCYLFILLALCSVTKV